MLRSFLTWFSLLIMATALAACCGSTACECDDAFADAVGLRLDTLGTATSPAFRPTEIDTVYLVRVPRDTAQRPRADTVQIDRTTAQARRQPVLINNATPFAQAGNRKLDRYSYQLYLAPTRRSPHSFDFFIDSVQLRTGFRAEGCCTCFENDSKLIFLRSQPGVPIDRTDPAGNNALVTLPVLRRP